MITYTCKPFEELSLQELYDIMVLRQQVFIVEQNCVFLDADGKKDFKSWHLMGRNEVGELVVYTRLVPEGVAYDGYTSIGRVANAASVRGTGAGKSLMNASIEWLEKLYGKEVPIKIGAQSYLIKFYSTFGFEYIGEDYMEDGIPHTIMIKYHKTIV